MFRLFSVISILFSCACGAEIHAIKSLDGGRELFQSLGKGDLALFDIDMVLIQTANPTFQMPAIVQHRDIWREIMGGLPLDHRDRTCSLMVVQDEGELVEEEMVALIEELQLRDVATYTLTASLSGKLAHVDDMETFRTDQLQRHGLRLTREQMIFCNGSQVPKGEVLVEQLKEQGRRPPKILFIDDRLANVEEVEETLAREFPEIDFLGVHYKGALYVTPADVSSDIFRERLQSLVDQAVRFD